MTLIIGMNSGSSFDDIDAVLAEISIAPDGHPTKPKFIDGIAYPWREDVANEYGIPAQFKKAIKFAALGYAAINQRANNIPAASGASQFNILGKIAQAPRYARGIP